MTSRTPDSQAPIVLSLQSVSKRFGTVQALRDVSVDCRAGEIHAVVGENGSGKSTLLGIASGYLVPDEGAVEIGAAELHTSELHTTRAGEARRFGLGMAYQTYSHVLELSVAENLFLAAPPEERPAFGNADAWAVAKLEEFDLYVCPSARMGSLSLSLRQFLEVVKALLSRPNVLLLDEPTTALGPGEVERLHELVLAQAAQGVGVVYVSHRLPEVLGIAHRVTVLRDGESQGTFEAAEMSEEHLVALMIGRPLELAFPDTDGGRCGKDVLLHISGFKGHRFGPLDVDVRLGEILGIAGAAGNGQEELLQCLAGVEQAAAGTVRCNGVEVDLRSPYAALRAGILLLSSDRTGESLFPVLGVRANATVQVLRRFSHAGWLRRGKESDAVSELARRLKIRTPSIDQPVRFLSGGNQQKVVLTRPFLRGDVRVIIADEPTQGVDVRSRFDIYAALRSKANEGVAIILKSSDPLELAGLCDRVIVISRGQIVDEIPEVELSEKRIIEAIVGSKALAPVLAAEEAG